MCWPRPIKGARAASSRSSTSRVANFHWCDPDFCGGAAFYTPARDRVQRRGQAVGNIRGPLAYVTLIAGGDADGRSSMGACALLGRMMAPR